MFGLDELIADLAGDGSPAVVLVVALLLGLRHASDPDHLVAVSTLVATDPERRPRIAARLGLAWGSGHALTLLLLGLPIVFVGAYLPDAAQRAAEALVGVVIVVLAVRLLRRWRHGRFHAHEHEHGQVRHRHLHPHGDMGGHGHGHERVRSPAQAFGVGLLHGAGGSAAVGVLLLASISSRVEATVALGVFAVATAASMTVLSLAFGYALARENVRGRLPRLAPLLGALSLAFGAWYTIGALSP
ncbi:MAG TPA: sulfite exporter TauE/SafE family protein [Gaiellaceae bacterium]|nr:sulfite exporter TauE/SafE family protein [Gaiellaceae bacterium]